jgi:hypothetical protein
VRIVAVSAIPPAAVDIYNDWQRRYTTIGSAAEFWFQSMWPEIRDTGKYTDS